VVELVGSVAAAVAAARSELLLVLGADFRPRADWLERLTGHLREGGREAVLKGEGGGLLTPAPYAVLIGRAKAAGLAHPDLKGLRRSLSREAGRLG
jgi:hypothetical protein